MIVNGTLKKPVVVSKISYLSIAYRSNITDPAWNKSYFGGGMGRREFEICEIPNSKISHEKLNLPNTTSILSIHLFSMSYIKDVIKNITVEQKGATSAMLSWTDLKNSSLASKLNVSGFAVRYNGTQYHCGGDVFSAPAGVSKGQLFF